MPPASTATEHTSVDVSMAIVFMEGESIQRLDVNEAVDRVCQQVPVKSETESVPVVGASGRVAAEEIVAPISLPPFASSAMDGYAVAAQDVIEPRTPLTVQGQSLAGHPFPDPLLPGHCVRVFTGAAMPPGADAVAIQEEVARDGDTARVDPLPAGTYVREIGNDVHAGDRLLDIGRRINAFDVGWMTACGLNAVRVRGKPTVAVFSTGDELRTPGTELGPGQIYDSNRTAIGMLLTALPVDVMDLGVFPDDESAISGALSDAARNADIVLTSGGVSVGDADLVRGCVERLGNIDFWRLDLKPGKPLAVGAINESVFFGLPGNPVSTIVCTLLIVRPAILKMCGASNLAPQSLPAVAGEPILHDTGRTEFQRGIVGERDGVLVVVPTGDQGSNRLQSFSKANCLIEIGRAIGNVDVGQHVRVLPFESLLY